LFKRRTSREKMLAAKDKVIIIIIIGQGYMVNILWNQQV